VKQRWLPPFIAASACLFMVIAWRVSPTTTFGALLLVFGIEVYRNWRRFLDDR